MSFEVRLSLFSESSTVRLSRWLKREGDRVEADEPIAEVETDKTIAEVVSPGAGILERICVPAGDESVEANALLAILVDEPSTTSSIAIPNETPAPQTIEVAPMEPTRNHDIAATPLARRMAEIVGLDLATIPKRNPAGRLVKADVERALHALEGGAAIGDDPTRTRAIEVEERSASSSEEPGISTSLPIANGQALLGERPMSTLRRITAERLTLAKQTIPHFYLEMDCEMDTLLGLRAEINNALPVEERLTVTDFAVRALAVGLRRVPLAHCVWTGTSVRLLESTDVAVAIMTEQGLIAPIIRAADRKSIRALSRELKNLTTQARSGRLEPGACSGGSCTISNLGMHGVRSLHAIVNPPQSGIIGIGTASKRAVVQGDAIVARVVMTCTFSGDHRAMDGVTGAELLAEFKRLLEAPLALVF